MSKSKDSYLNKSHPPWFGPSAIKTTIIEPRDPKEIVVSGAETWVLEYPVTPVLLSSKVPEQPILEEVVPLSEYKFDLRILVMVKRTPKRKITLMKGVERVLIKGYEENKLWDLLGQDNAQVGVETLVIILGMAMVGQSSLEAMEK